MVGRRDFLKVLSAVTGTLLSPSLRDAIEEMPEDIPLEGLSDDGTIGGDVWWNNDALGWLASAEVEYQPVNIVEGEPLPQLNASLATLRVFSHEDTVETLMNAITETVPRTLEFVTGHGKKVAVNGFIRTFSKIDTRGGLDQTDITIQCVGPVFVP